MVLLIENSRSCAGKCLHTNRLWFCPREFTTLKGITGNRRWREEEFLIPRHLTEGVKRLAIKIQHIPDNRDLFPGRPFEAESAWSESRYWAYCYKMPKVKLAQRR
jgi:hypothetical protein